MKTMSVLPKLAEELYASVSERIDEPLRTQLHESLECGEEGVAVLFTLQWAIETHTSIDEHYWLELNDYFATGTTELSQSIRERIEKVAHAA